MLCSLPPPFLRKKISKTAPLSFALPLVGRSVDLVDAPQGSGLVPSFMYAPPATFLRTPGRSAESNGALLIQLVTPREYANRATRRASERTGPN